MYGETLGNTVYREMFAPVLFLPLTPSLSVDEFKTGRIPKSQINSLITQLCLGEFKTGQNHLQMQMGENNTGWKQPCIQCVV